MHYTEGSFFPVLFSGLLSAGVRNAPVPFFIKPLTGKIAGTIESGCKSTTSTFPLGSFFTQLERSQCQKWGNSLLEPRSPYRGSIWY